MDLKTLIRKNRSYRRFFHNISISKEVLVELIDLARNSPNGKNFQPLRYFIVNTETDCEKVFPNLVWAALLKDWDGPVPNERPSAYIIVLFDKNQTNHRWDDAGIASHSILLGATEKGLGGCIMASVNRNELMKIFNIPESLGIYYVIAMGKPKEIIVLDEMEKDGNTDYWRDKDQVHHVPKRKLEDIILNW